MTTWAERPRRELALKPPVKGGGILWLLAELRLRPVSSGVVQPTAALFSNRGSYRQQLAPTFVSQSEPSAQARDRRGSFPGSSSVRQDNPG